MATKSYSEKDIQSFQGLSGIRRRPTVYVGQMNSNALFIIAKELLDNTADEHMAGRNKFCHVSVEDNTVTVLDHGTGIPVGPISIQEANGTKTKISALEAIVSRMHTGGKFDAEKGAYGDGSIGVNGVGIKATNALSASFEVWTKRDGKIWYTSYKKGVIQTPVTAARTIPKIPDAKASTVVRYTPDLSLFEKGSKLDVQNIYDWANLASKLNAGFTIDVTAKGETKRFFSKAGVADYLTELVEALGATPLHKDALVLRAAGLDLALMFTDYDGIGLQGHTNGIHNSKGGLHVDNALAKMGEELFGRRGAKQKFRMADLYEGVVGIVNVRISSPQFTTQTKELLVDTRVSSMFDGLGADIKKFFDGHKALAKELCDRASELRKMKDDFKANKDASRRLKGGRSGPRLPTKLLSAKCEPGKRVLYLVEGDSAAGGCQRARDSDYQEVLPLRGKIMNAFKVPKGKRIWDSDEVLNILQAIGYDPSAEHPLSNMRVGKIVLLGDADVDGKHINLLNLSLLARLCPQVIEKGMVYIGRGYEYLIQDDDGSFYCGDSVSELKKTAPAKLHGRILHMKGLGEAEWQALRYMVFDPKTARLQQVKLDKEGIHTLKALMGDDVSIRKGLLGIE